MASSSPGDSKIFQWDFTMLNHASFHSYSRGIFLLLIFVSLVIFITTLSLYAHWICSHHLHRLSADAAATAAAAASPAGLDPDSINSLPIILHNNSEGKNSYNNGEIECSICLGVFEEEEKLKVLPECNHAYHSECVDKWLSSQSSCPLCRASLSPATAP